MKKIIFYTTLLFMCVTWAQADSSNPRETPAVKVVRDNADAVVNISTEQIVYLRNQPYWGGYGSEFDYFFDQFFGLDRSAQALKLHSVGSGVIVDNSGLVVTNAHVIHMATNVFVILKDKTKLKGEVVYEDPEKDLAIVKVESAKPLTQVTLGQTQDIMIGESVVAIGNPLGFENSVTVGVVSGKDREISSPEGDVVFGGLLQIDAPINPGNSGGALLNLNGELVGVNVAVVQNSQSIGFAIPVEKVKEAIAAHQHNKDFAIKHREPRALSTPPSAGFTQNQPVQPSVPSQGEQWDPFTEMDQMMEQMDQLFENSLSHRGGQKSWGMFNTDLSFDQDLQVEETDKAYVVKLDIPGLNKNKLNIEITQHALTVSGESSLEKKESGAGRTAHSQSYSSFLKTIPLPEDADADKMTTETKGETLVITLPKKT